MREKLIELLNEIQDSGVVETPAGFGSKTDWIKNERVADHLIANGVTIPVQCKDCIHWNGNIGSCDEFSTHRFPAGGRIAFLTRDDDFCSYGERKDV